MIFQNESHKQYFICQTSAEVPLLMLFDKTNANTIYCKTIGTGFLVLLRYFAKNEKKHSTVDNSIVELDTLLMRGSASGCSATSFVSVSDVGSGKVKSFSGKDRLRDHLFREIFDVMQPKQNKEYRLRDGVRKFDAATLAAEERAKERAREVEDILFQQKSMEQDPEAYGGSTTLDGGSKMMMTVAAAAGASSSSGGVDDTATATASATVMDDHLHHDCGGSETTTPMTVEKSAGAVVGSSSSEDDAVDYEDNVEELEEALLVERLRVEELLGAKATVEQELLAVKAELSAAKAASEQELSVVGASLSAARTELATAGKAATEALAKERQRAERAETARERAEVVKEQVIAQRNEVLLKSVELERRQNEALAQIAGFPAQLAEALRQKHEHYEREGAATVRLEIAKRSAALDEFHKRETDKLVQGMLHDAQKQLAPLQLRIGSLEVEVRNAKAQMATLKEENRVAVRELSDTRRRLKQAQKKRGGDGGADQVQTMANNEGEGGEADAAAAGRQKEAEDAAEIERLHAQVVWFCFYCSAIDPIYHFYHDSHYSQLNSFAPCSSGASASGRRGRRRRTRSWTRRCWRSGAGAWRRRSRRRRRWATRRRRRWSRTATSTSCRRSRSCSGS
jgi:hypothetical protein